MASPAVVIPNGIATTASAAAAASSSSSSPSPSSSSLNNQNNNNNNNTNTNNNNSDANPAANNTTTATSSSNHISTSGGAGVGAGAGASTTTTTSSSSSSSISAPTSATAPGTATTVAPDNARTLPFSSSSTSSSTSPPFPQSPSASASAPASASTNTNATTAIKRKREMSIVDPEKSLDNNQENNHHQQSAGSTSTTTIANSNNSSNKSKNNVVNGNGANPEDVQSTIRDYFEVLQRFDATPSILKRPLPEPESIDEPQAKRKKSEEPDAPTRPSIAEKVAKGGYKDVDTLIIDIKHSAAKQMAELRAVEAGKDPSSNDVAIARTLAFKQKAHEIFRREMIYPRTTHGIEALHSLDSTHALQTSASGTVVLSVNGPGSATRPLHLYSSLQQPVPTPDDPEGTVRALSAKALPPGVKMTKVMPYSFPPAVEKEKKSKTLGELFPTPSKLPHLQPPKAPKSITKGVQVSWHRPELTEKSKYRAGSYFSQNLTTGKWLDYSNAGPPSQVMTKQRERAMSLAGAKPSSSDLEASEMESLFRGAFSSFAPSKDDSASTISSGMVSQTTWWQKVGRRNLDRLLEVEYTDDSSKDVEMADAEPAEEVDESLIQEVIDNWDEAMVDPSLEEACCPKKSDAEKDTDDILQDVSDMIQTLISFQRNRNLQLPTASGQNRYAADPANSDMLANGVPAQPSEEELATYEALKAQLLVVIQMLPPYAVARLNSDKLDELNISTKLEIRTDEYQGVMEEDEAAARARAASMAASNARPTTHRPSNSSSNVQYSQQYSTPNRAPMPSQPYYPPAQTPVRQHSVQRPPQTMPPTYQQRPPSNAGYRPPNHYPGTPYAQQLAKAPAPYSQPGPYGGTPPPGRPTYQQYPGYPNAASHTPQPRYPSYTSNPQIPPPSYHHHQPYQPQHQHPHTHQQPGTPTHVPPYNQYTNGAATMPPRTSSPHIAHQPPMPQPGYNPAATPTRQPSYGGQPNIPHDPSRRYYQPTGSPAMQHHQHPPPQQGGQNRGNSNNFQTSLNPIQVQQAMDQAKARFETQKGNQRPNEAMRNSMSGQGPGPGHPQITAPVGLGGIGLGTPAARPNMPGGAPASGYNPASPSPKPPANAPPAARTPPTMNGSPAVPASIPPAANGATAGANSET